MATGSREQRANLLELANALLTGRANKAWAARAIRARAFMAAAFGGAALTVPAKPLSPPPRGFRPLRPSPRSRAAAIDTAEAFYDVLAGRKLDQLPGYLADEVWTFLPTGTLSRHERAPLAAELALRPGDTQPILKKLARSYTLPELVSALPRGVAGALDTLLDLRSTLIVTHLIEGGRGPAGRLMLLLTEVDGKWKLRSFPIGAPDDAFVASERAPDHERPELGISAQLVRHVVMGHSAQLKADLHQLMPSLFVREEFVPSAALVEIAEDGGPRLGSTEAVVGTPELVPLPGLSKLVARPIERRIREKALEDFGLPFDRLKPRLVRTPIGMFDPASNRVAPAQEAHTLVFVIDDGTPPRPRCKVGGLFM